MRGDSRAQAEGTGSVETKETEEHNIKVGGGLAQPGGGEEAGARDKGQRV